MSIDDVILVILALWVSPMILFIFYFLTDPVPGKRFWRRLIDLRTLKPISLILVTQKASLILVVGFIFLVRFTGGFPGREWVAAALYGLLVLVAWWAHIDLRRLQRPQERRTRKR